MVYKSIELQASIPRTLEMTSLQHQQQHRATTEQSLLGQQVMKGAEHNAKRSTKAEAATNDTISERDPRNPNQHSSKRKRKAAHKKEDVILSEHPYKGKHIDFTG